MGFQARPNVDLFTDIDSDQLKSFLSENSVNYLDISYSRGIIFAYLNHNLKLVSIDKLSNFLESNENNDNIDTVLYSFPIDLNVTHIKLNFNESSLYLSSTDSNTGKVSITTVDVNILVNGTYNHQLIHTFDDLSSLLRILPHPNDESLALCHFTNGSLYFMDITTTCPTPNRLRTNATAATWFNDNIVLKDSDSSKIQFSNVPDYFVPFSSFDIELEENYNIYFLKQINDKYLMAIAGEEINADETNNYITYFYQLDPNNLSLIDSSSTDVLYAPYGAIPRIASFYTLLLNQWSTEYPEILISIGSKAIDIDLFFPNQTTELLNDSDRATMPMDDDSGDDDTPLGLILDLNSNINVKQPCKGVDESDPLPRIIILTNRGQLISWNVWSKNDILNKKTDLSKAKNLLIKNTPQISLSEIKQASNIVQTRSTTTSKNVFGQTSSSIFGQSNNTSNPFGGSSPFGQTKPQASSSVSTAAPTPVSNTPKPTVPSTTPQTEQKPNNLFGGSMFGQPTTNTSNSAFGGSSFGSSMNGFKMNQSKPSTQTSTSTPFGASSMLNQTSGFGKFAQPSSQGNAFSSLGNTNNSLFGNMSAGGASPFGSLAGNNKPTDETKSSTIFGSSESKPSPFGSLAGNNKSTEETKSIFGSTENKTSSFGGLNKPTVEAKPMFGSTENKSSPFGSFSIGEKKAETTGSSPFGASPFGNNSSNLFGGLSLNKKESSPFAGLSQPKKEETKSTPSDAPTSSKPSAFSNTQASNMFGKPTNFINGSKPVLSFNDSPKQEKPDVANTTLREFDSEEEESESDQTSDETSDDEIIQLHAPKFDSSKKIIEELDQSEEFESEEEDDADTSDYESASETVPEPEPIKLNISSEPKIIKNEIPQLAKSIKDLPLDEQLDDFKYEFDFQHKNDAEKAVKMLIKSKLVQLDFEGSEKAYKDFLAAQSKIYDSEYKDVNKIIEDWTTAYLKKLKEKEENAELMKKKQHEDNLANLVKIREENDKVFKEADEDRKKLLEALKLEKSIREAEKSRVQKEIDEQERIRKEEKEHEENELKDREFIKATLKEIEEANEDQLNLIEQEKCIEAQLKKEEEERALKRSALLELRTKKQQSEDTKEVTETIDIGNDEEEVVENLEEKAEETSEEKAEETAEDKVEDKIEDKVEDKVEDEVEDKVEDKVKDKVEDEKEAEKTEEKAEEGSDEEADDVKEKKPEEEAEPVAIKSNTETEIKNKEKAKEVSEDEINEICDTSNDEINKEVLESAIYETAKENVETSTNEIEVESTSNEPIKSEIAGATSEDLEKASSIDSEKSLEIIEKDDVEASENEYETKPVDSNSSEITKDTENVISIEEKLDAYAANIDKSTTESLKDEKLAPENTSVEKNIDTEMKSADSSAESFQVVSPISTDEQKAEPKVEEIADVNEKSVPIEEKIADSKEDKPVDKVKPVNKSAALSSMFADDVVDKEEEDDVSGSENHEEYADSPREIMDQELEFEVSAEDDVTPEPKPMINETVEAIPYSQETVDFKNDVFQSNTDTDNLTFKSSTITTFESSNTEKSNEYQLENVSTSLDSKSTDFAATSENFNVSSSPDYTSIGTEIDHMRTEKTTSLDDEVYFSQHYLPLPVPLVHARGKTEYPAEFEKLPSMGKQMKKLIYDVCINFSIIHKNIDSLNVFFADHSNDTLLFHTLKNSSSYSNFWRLFEIPTVLQGAEKNVNAYDDITAHYKELDANADELRKTIIKSFKNISTYKEALDKISNDNINQKKMNLNSDRPLPYENVQTRRKLRANIKRLQDIDRTVQSEILLLKSQIYPEAVVRDERTINSVISSLQKHLYSHAETISDIVKGFETLKDQEETKKGLLEGSGGNSSPILSISDIKKQPVSRITSMVTNLNSKKSLSTILRGKINNSRYISY